jgi:hypothetical protein
MPSQNCKSFLFFDCARGKTEHEVHKQPPTKEIKENLLPFKAPNSKVAAVIAHKP